MDAIRPWLYIGKYQETLEPDVLFRNQIHAKLHLAAPRTLQSVRSVADAINYPELTSLYLPIEDGVALPIPLFRQGIDFVLTEKRQGKRVLVSCGAGISRSATFAIAALKEAEGLPLVDAAQIVKSCHPRTRPHPELWESLCAYYREQVPGHIVFRF